MQVPYRTHRISAVPRKCLPGCELRGWTYHIPGYVLISAGAPMDKAWCIHISIRATGEAQPAECLPSRYEILGSIPSTIHPAVTAHTCNTP